MLMRIVWLAPVAMLLMFSAPQPLMTTLSVALGATVWLRTGGHNHGRCQRTGQDPRGDRALFI